MWHYKGVYIVTVHPIIRSTFKDTLTYWSPHLFTIGTVIKVPFRNKEIPALVESCVSAEQSKSSIKNADFVTRKIEKKKELKIVSPALIKACISTATEFASKLGPLIKTMIPECAFDFINPEKTEENKNPKLTLSQEIFVFQTNTDDRYATYKSIIREEFARKKSVIIVAPTINSAEEIYDELNKGIQNYAFMIHGTLSKKKLAETWKNAITSEHSVAIILTPTYLGIPRDDIATIIVEREASRVYKNMRRPFFDYRFLFEKYAKEIGARIIYGDTLLRVDTLYRREIGETHDFFPISFRVEKKPEFIIVDMKDPLRKDKIKLNKQNDFVSAIFSEELESQIDYAGKKNEKIVVLSSRRGLSPQTVCGDCAQTVLCEQCQAPVVLHQSKSESKRYFLCHHCGKDRSALEACKNCNSWKLVTLGIGSDTIFTEIQKRFKDRPVFRLDKDSVTTDKQARDLYKKFNNTVNGILVGTEYALSFIKSVPHVAIASMDSLFSLPDFRVNERICHMLLKIGEVAEKYALIQTRNADHPLLQYIQTSNLNDFYRSEIQARKELKYPPFSTFIKITIEAEKNSAAKSMEKLQNILEKWSPTIFPAFIPSVGGKSILHMLISLPINKEHEAGFENWPDQDLINILSNLPEEFTVRVHPDSLL